MSIFGKIKDAIFGKHAEAAETGVGAGGGINSSSGPATVPGTIPAAQPASTAAAPSGASPEPQQNVTPQAPAPGAPAGASASGAATASSAPVDVAAVMDRAVKDSGQTLHWRKSVVDMMKALGMESSLAERKELATELGYTGDQNDSATMNVWLHKALLKKLGENGGKVPAELLD